MGTLVTLLTLACLLAAVQCQLNTGIPPTVTGAPIPTVAPTKPPVTTAAPDNSKCGTCAPHQECRQVPSRLRILCDPNDPTCEQFEYFCGLRGGDSCGAGCPQGEECVTNTICQSPPLTTVGPLIAGRTAAPPISAINAIIYDPYCAEVKDCMPSKEKSGFCPHVLPGSVGVCGGTFCSSDSDCKDDDKCCSSPCGSQLCTAAIPDDGCGLCPPGESCVQMPGQCPPGVECDIRPPQCMADESNESDESDESMESNESDASDESNESRGSDSSDESDEKRGPKCRRTCPMNQKCKRMKPQKCKRGQRCDRRPKWECVRDEPKKSKPKGGCPKRMPLSPRSIPCMFQRIMRGPRQCMGDEMCRKGEKCCTNECGRNACVKPRRG